MPRARSKRGRVRQIAGALRDQFPVSSQVVVRVYTKQRVDAEDDKTAAACYQVKRRIFIDLDGNMSWWLLIDTFLHEWAHAIQIDRGRAWSHDDAYSRTHGRLYRWIHEGPGCEIANHYPE